MLLSALLLHPPNLVNHDVNADDVQNIVAGGCHVIKIKLNVSTASSTSKKVKENPMLSKSSGRAAVCTPISHSEIMAFSF